MRALLLALAAAAASATIQSRDEALARLSSPSVPATVRSMLGRALSTRSEAAWAARPALHDTDKTWCPANSFFEFIPAHVSQPKPQATWTGSCFANMQATYSWSGANASTLEVTLTGSQPTELLCGDLFIVSTRFDQRWVYLEDLSPNTTVRFDSLPPLHKSDILGNGVSVLVAPCGLLGTIESVLKTVGVFVGDNVAQNSFDFLIDRGTFPKNTQPYNKVQPVDASLIASGDYFAIIRMDGLDPMIAFGTGGVTGHSAVAVWDHTQSPPQLFVVESTDASPFGVYWPPPYGVIVTPYQQWIQQAINASYMVALLPVRRDLVFDESAFWKWFPTVRGQEYGYERFLFSFLDTSPEANLPLPIDDEVSVWLLNTLDILLPYNPADPDDKVTAYRMLVKGMNKRVPTGAPCTTIACIQEKLVATNASIVDLVAEPELDSWTYLVNGTQQNSMVCSVFAAAVWQVGFGKQMPIFQTAEQTPKDNYQFAIYEPAVFTSANCPAGLHTTPHGTYCQLMGPWELPLNDYNAIKPYTAINTRCMSQWPSYIRCPGGGLSCDC